MPLTPSVLAVVERAAACMATQRTGRCRVEYRLWRGPERLLLEEETSDVVFDLDRRCGESRIEERNDSPSELHESRLFLDGRVCYSRFHIEPPSDEDERYDELDPPSDEDEKWVRRRVPPGQEGDLESALAGNSVNPFDFHALVGLPQIQARLGEAAGAGRLAIEFGGDLGDFPFIVNRFAQVFNGKGVGLPALVRIEIDLATEMVASATVEVTAPPDFEGGFRVSCRVAYFGYGRPVRIEEPAENECIPDIPPIAAKVSAISTAELSYRLHLRLEDGSDLDLPVFWLGGLFLDHGTYPLVRPVVGERLLLSGDWKEAGDRSRSSGASERGNDDDFFDPESIFSPRRGFLLEAQGCREPICGASRDAQGMLEAETVIRGSVLEVSDLKERRRVDFLDAEGNAYWRSAEVGGLDATIGEPATLYLSPNLGGIMIDYALRPDGSVLVGYEPDFLGFSRDAD